MFRATTMPTHRALADARATVDVLHALIERVGQSGRAHLDRAAVYLPEVTPAQRRKRSLAETPAERAGLSPLPRSVRGGPLRWDGLDLAGG